MSDRVDWIWRETERTRQSRKKTKKLCSIVSMDFNRTTTLNKLQAVNQKEADKGRRREKKIESSFESKTKKTYNPLKSWDEKQK